MSTKYGLHTYVGFAIASVALLSLRFVRAPWFRWPAFVLALLMAYSSVPENFAARGLQRVKDDFALTVSAHEFIGQHLNPSRGLRMWYALADGEPRPYRNISSSYLWGYVNVNEAMPSLQPDQAASLDLRAQFVVLAANQREVDAARAALRKAGIAYSPQVQREFGPHDARFVLVIGDLSPVAESSE